MLNFSLFRLFPKIRHEGFLVSSSTAKETPWPSISAPDAAQRSVQAQILRNMRFSPAANQQPAKPSLFPSSNPYINWRPSCLCNVGGHHCSHKESFDLGYRSGCSGCSRRSRLVLLFQQRHHRNMGRRRERNNGSKPSLTRGGTGNHDLVRRRQVNRQR